MASPLAEALALYRSGTAARPIVVAIAEDFVHMETGQLAQVEVLRRLTDEAFPFDCVVASLYAAAHCYGLFVQTTTTDRSRRRRGRPAPGNASSRASRCRAQVARVQRRPMLSRPSSAWARISLAGAGSQAKPPPLAIR